MRFPLLSGREVAKIFGALGWEIACQKGSHIATLSVPDHKEIAKGTLRKLITRAGITVEEFMEAMK